jgi:hypothetical protein
MWSERQRFVPETKGNTSLELGLVKLTCVMPKSVRDVYGSEIGVVE